MFRPLMSAITIGTVLCSGLLAQEESDSCKKPKNNETKVIRRVSLTEQTGAVSKRIFFTPTEDAMFRVSAYGIVTGNYTSSCTDGAEGTALIISPAFTLTDDFTTTMDTGDFLLSWRIGGGPAGPHTSLSTVFRAKKGTPVDLEMDVIAQEPNCTVEGVRYDVFFVAEQL
jgi:hypothetical protein